MNSERLSTALILTIACVLAAATGSIVGADPSAGASPAVDPTATSFDVPPADHAWLRDAGLSRELHDAISNARHRVLVVMFLMSSSELADHPVHRLINDLAAAHARGVDVMVVLDESYREKNEIAFRQLTDAGVDVRWDDPTRITHSKLVVADDLVFVGSANWSAIALTGGNIESTVRLDHHDLANRLYDIRLLYFTGAESQVITRAGKSLATTAALELKGDGGGQARRSLAAAGVDVDGLMAAGAGVIGADGDRFRNHVRSELEIGTGWARWGLPEVEPGTLILPEITGGIVAIRISDFTILSGSMELLPRTPALQDLARRCTTSKKGNDSKKR